MRYFGYITNGCVTFDKLCNLSLPPFRLLFFNPHLGCESEVPCSPFRHFSDQQYKTNEACGPYSASA